MKDIHRDWTLNLDNCVFGTVFTIELKFGFKNMTALSHSAFSRHFTGFALSYHNELLFF